MPSQFARLACLLALLGLAGCALLNEDPNSSELPQATPPPWDRSLPGMPSGSGG